MGDIVRLESHSVRKGRDVLRRILDTAQEMTARHERPAQIEISTALCDDLRAFFDYAYEFDGVLPPSVHVSGEDIPIVYTPGASRRVRFMREVQ